MTDDSTSTDPSTWPRPAPIARSIANSRVRWATVIENVLKMMNPPTTSAMTAKPIMRCRRSPSPACAQRGPRRRACAPVTASTSTRRRPTPRPRSLRDRVGDAPGASATTTLSCRPGSPRRAWAVVSSNNAVTVPNRPSASPKVAMPLTSSGGFPRGPGPRRCRRPRRRARRRRHGRSRPARSPTAVTVDDRHGLSRSSAIQFSPTGSTPEDTSPSSVPSGPTSCAHPLVRPAAAATPSIAATVAHDGAGIRSRWASGRIRSWPSGAPRGRCWRGCRCAWRRRSSGGCRSG
jgi:hypothetical protein